MTPLEVARRVLAEPLASLLVPASVDLEEGNDEECDALSQASSGASEGAAPPFALIMSRLSGFALFRRDSGAITSPERRLLAALAAGAVPPLPARPPASPEEQQLEEARRVVGAGTSLACDRPRPPGSGGGSPRGPSPVMACLIRAHAHSSARAPPCPQPSNCKATGDETRAQ